MSKDQYLYLWAQWGVLNFESYQLLKKKFEDLQTAWERITPEFFYPLGMGREKISRIFMIKQQLSFQDITRRMEEVKSYLLCVDDADYPEGLKQSSNPPPFLFVRGKLPSFHKSIAVVGTRAMTSYGQYATEKLTRQLTQSGFVIVSGLALGVDACAHETTLSARGITVAVLGSGVDQIYPATNQHLAKRILQAGGAILSAYPLGAPAAKHHFPERNAIVSALCQGVLVTEGGIKSGALITARLALHQNREVFAVPNNINKTGLSGTNFLIRKGEAKLVEAARDILEEFKMEEGPDALALQFDEGEKRLLHLLSRGPQSLDQLTSLLNCTVPFLSKQLMELNLKGVIRLQGNDWVIA